mgnify:CR=1 FL=1|tara:strand:+ start:48214 stop:48681 length:468 start_codon:yes stop_codon:yes gene_type:complete
MDINIINFENKFEKNFYELNIEWLEKFFRVEEYDYKVLSNSKKYIIDKGGEIFFAKNNLEIIGTVALMPTSDKNIFELTKMAVKPSYQNLGIGRRLLEKCLEFSKEKKYNSMILYSNRKLKNAIYLYKAYGFKEVEIENNSPYLRANIKMEIKIN